MAAVAVAAQHGFDDVRHGLVLEDAGIAAFARAGELGFEAQLVPRFIAAGAEALGMADHAAPAQQLRRGVGKDVGVRVRAVDGEQRVAVQQGDEVDVLLDGADADIGGEGPAQGFVQGEGFDRQQLGRQLGELQMIVLLRRHGGLSNWHHKNEYINSVS